ncbi:MAG: hypothetical protein LCI00_06460 [Chloroflexi bacterium]|nr:hypothetical protein [Chloroflexota bacterium]MCC6891767.1 hypothetical protein [Anaerolineae bacterium]
MITERRQYTEEFKREAVRLMESSSKPIADWRVIWGTTTTICIAGGVV